MLEGDSVWWLGAGVVVGLWLYRRYRRRRPAQPGNKVARHACMGGEEDVRG